MKLTDETIKRIRHNKYSVDCIQGMCTLSDGDIIANLCDTIEALQQDNADWQKRYEELDAGNSRLYKDFCGLKQENEQLKAQNKALNNALEKELKEIGPIAKEMILKYLQADYHNPADVEALKQAKEAIEHHLNKAKIGIGGGDDLREALAAINKITR